MWLTPTSSTSDDALGVVRDLAEWARGTGASDAARGARQEGGRQPRPHAVAAALTRAALTSSAAVEVHMALVFVTPLGLQL